MSRRGGENYVPNFVTSSLHFRNIETTKRFHALPAILSFLGYVRFFEMIILFQKLTLAHGPNLLLAAPGVYSAAPGVQSAAPGAELWLLR